VDGTEKVRAEDVGIVKVGGADVIRADGDSISTVLGVVVFRVDEIDVLGEDEAGVYRVEGAADSVALSSLSWRPRASRRCESRRSGGRWLECLVASLSSYDSWNHTQSTSF
jgi:hypothetical protein